MVVYIKLQTDVGFMGSNSTHHRYHKFSDYAILLCLPCKHLYPKSPET